jgi:tryptophan halogenase
MFHHYLARQGVRDLEPFLMSAVAARQGVFAHPLEKGAQPLARGEYGYQFDPQSYQVPFATAALAGKVRVIAAKITDIETGADGIASLRLSDGQSIRADLYIDCTGPQAQLLSRLDGQFSGGRRLKAVMSRRPSPELGPACRQLTGAGYGWQSDTPLQGITARLTVFAPEAETQALVAHGSDPQVGCDVRLGWHAQPWSGNVVAVGQAAGVLEPLTHAPMLLLQRDIERLASLVPFSTDMSMERREYNRQCNEDYAHAALFHRALFETTPLADSPYWSAARAEPVPDKLRAKLSQFMSRGLLVAFDLEPFNAEDWTILHLGMGRWPERHDRVADRATESDLRQFFANRRRDIDALVKSMPSHHRYVSQLSQHLRQRNL